MFADDPPEDEMPPEDKMEREAWNIIRGALVRFNGEVIGAYADTETNQVVVREFIPVGLALLLSSDPDDVAAVKGFLLTTLGLASDGVFCPSFELDKKPVPRLDWDISSDSGLWWIVLLNFYVLKSKDTSLLMRPLVQSTLKKTLSVCMDNPFTTLPTTLLCQDGCTMIDSRMGLHGYHFEIQALFYYALNCCKNLIRDDVGFSDRIAQHLIKLRVHFNAYYWCGNLNVRDSDNPPEWVKKLLSNRGGYFIGNASLKNTDYRWHLVGNCIAILSNLATGEQAAEIMFLLDNMWDELIGEMPLKIVYPALEDYDPKIPRGNEPRNKIWSYHNGGSWPALLWLLVSASVKVEKVDFARDVIKLVEPGLCDDLWPEYYEGELEQSIGESAKILKTNTAASYVVSKLMLRNPGDNNLLFTDGEEINLLCSKELSSDERQKLLKDNRRILESLLIPKVRESKLQMEFDVVNLYSGHPEKVVSGKEWLYTCTNPNDKRKKLPVMFVYTEVTRRSKANIRVTKGGGRWMARGGRDLIHSLDGEELGSVGKFAYYLESKEVRVKRGSI